MKKNLNKDERYQKFMADTFVVCDECGYNNPKERFEGFGTCLRCKKILDERVYFKAQMKKMAKTKPIKKRVKGVLTF